MALARLGGLESVKEQCRAAGRAQVLDGIWRDLRQAARAARRAPTLALTVVVTLAAGVGVTTAIVGAVDALMLHPLPYPDPDRVVVLEANPPQAFVSFRRGGTFVDSDLTESVSLAATGVVTSGGLNLGTTAPEHVRVASVGGEFFDVLRPTAVLGRAITAADRGQPVAVLSDRLWRRRFAADPGILGRPVVLHHRGFTVIGLMPPGVEFPDAVDLWIPDGADDQVTGGAVRLPTVIARLTPGVGLQEATDEVRRLHTSVQPETIALVTLRRAMLGDVRLPVVVVLGGAAALLVLLLGGFNVATLLSTRLAAREREFAMRWALGGSRVQLTRQILCESLLLAGVACILALPAAAWALDAIRAVLPVTLPGSADVDVTGRTLAVTAVLAIGVGLAAGLGPALAAGRSAGADLLPGASGMTVRPVWRRFHGGLVVAQIGASLVLLLAAVTIARTVAELATVDIGVRSDDALVVDLTLASAGDATLYRSRQFYAEVERRLRALPGVDGVGGAEQVPGEFSTHAATQLALEGDWKGPTIEALGDGRSLARMPRDVVYVPLLCATPGYFGALGIEMLAGRPFREADDADAPRVAIVSASFARRLGISPGAILGRRTSLTTEGPAPESSEIVGVVRDVRADVRRPFEAAVYAPCTQHLTAFHQPALHMVVRSRMDAAALLPALRAVVARLDPTVPVSNVRRFREMRASSLAASPRHLARLADQVEAAFAE